MSSGMGTDVATGVFWDGSCGGMEAGGSGEKDKRFGGANSSVGVRNPSFEGSASSASADESRRSQSVGDSSGFAVTGCS